VDAKTGKRIMDSRVPLGPIRTLSPDGQFCLHHEWQDSGSGKVTMHVELKERVTGRTRWRQSVPYPVLRSRRVSALDSWAEFTVPDGRFVMLTVRVGFHLFESATGRPVFGSLFAKPLPENAEYLGLSPDGRMMAVCLSWPTGTVAFIELATGRQRRSMPGIGWPVSSFVFAPGGRDLIACDSDGTALVWDCYGAPSVSRPITPEVARGLWDDLGGASARRAFDGICSLVAYPRAGVALIARELPPCEIDARWVRHLLAELDADSFEQREAAQQQLEALGNDVEGDLLDALAAKPTLEFKRRAERLLKALPKADPKSVLQTRALEVLERIGTPDAVAVLKKLANGAAGSRLTREARESLDRVKRFSIVSQPGLSR
jgi:hypothetical protein